MDERETHRYRRRSYVVDEGSGAFAAGLALIVAFGFVVFLIIGPVITLFLSVLGFLFMAFFIMIALYFGLILGAGLLVGLAALPALIWKKLTGRYPKWFTSLADESEIRTGFEIDYQSPPKKKKVFRPNP